MWIEMLLEIYLNCIVNVAHTDIWTVARLL